MPSLENNGLIPAYLVTWLLAGAGIVCAVAFTFTDKALRNRK